MREQEGANTVKQFTGRDVPVVVDPTMLLTPDEWRKVSRQPAWYRGEDYILTYFLGNRPNAAIQQVANKSGLPSVNLLDEDVYEHYVTGVDEFIWAIEHASLIYTDSFHGTVFSILFQRPFVVCNRVGEEAVGKMSSRIDTLLSYFGLVIIGNNGLRYLGAVDILCCLSLMDVLAINDISMWFKNGKLGLWKLILLIGAVMQGSLYLYDMSWGTASLSSFFSSSLLGYLSKILLSL